MMDETVYCESCQTEHEILIWHSLGLICARCNKHTGNNSQGHYWGLCKGLLRQGTPFEKAVRELHFCCPGDCELEVDSPSSP